MFIFLFLTPDPSKPFAWDGAGASIFRGATSGGQDDEGDDGEVVASNDIHFEPIVQVPGKQSSVHWKARLHCHLQSDTLIHNFYMTYIK